MFAVLFASFLLATPQTSAAPVCEGAEECEVKWGRAIRWVLDRNGALREQSENLIATKSIQETTENAYQVSRIPLGGGRYQIEMKMECANVFSCRVKRSKADFAKFVNG